jgi:hypothetical protein
MIASRPDDFLARRFRRWRLTSFGSLPSTFTDSQDSLPAHQDNNTINLIPFSPHRLSIALIYSAITGSALSSNFWVIYIGICEAYGINIKMPSATGVFRVQSALPLTNILAGANWEKYKKEARIS